MRVRKNISTRGTNNLVIHPDGTVSRLATFLNNNKEVILPKAKA